jgi:hypothetical protein
MEHKTIVHDFDCFSFFQNVIQNKLSEANQHLKKLELYKQYPELFHIYTLNDIIDVHEEQNDFINIVYQQCHAWREHACSTVQHSQVNTLEEMTRKLETAVYHILYVVEQIKKIQGIAIGDENEEVCIKQ